ncbi:hypothetical protein ACOMCU_00220 [Lysinibacillus sp. UGB7]|uniref:hypothetical protein n=1 Tax=Lysinibacillus sp. UGB7 TaxID=3411039 RepID=UPI003B7C7386
MKMKSKFIASLLLATALLGACTQEEKPYTEAQEKEVLSELITEDSSIADTYAFKEKMDAELPRLSKDGSSDLVDTWLYTLYSETEALNNKLSAFQKELGELVEAENDPTSEKFDVNKVEDEALKAILKETAKLHVVMKTEFDRNSKELVFFLNPDFERILKDYKQYMDKDIIAYIEFNILQTGTNIVNEDGTAPLLPEVAKMIVELEGIIKTNEDSKYVPAFKQMLVYYYDIYFSVTAPGLLNAESTAYLDSTIESYSAHAEAYKTFQFGKDLLRILNVVQKTDGNLITNEVTDEVSQLLQERAPEEWMEHVDEGEEPLVNTGESEQEAESIKK